MYRSLSEASNREGGILWHKHIALKKSDDCIGCKKCIQVCPHGVFSVDMPDIVVVFWQEKVFVYNNSAIFLTY